MEEKKISFGFAKTIKKPLLQAGPAASALLKHKNDSIQMIDCMEEQQIKIIGITEEPPAPLVIPLREQDKTSVPERLAKLIQLKQDKRIRLQAERTGHVPGTSANAMTIKSEPTDDEHPPETLEQRAAREIVEQMQEANVKKEEENNFVIPLLPEELPLDGAVESTMADYETVSIEHFGLALLRGMGWKDTGKAKGPDLGPVLRPKGLGLGAERAMKANTNNAPLIPPAKGEVLVMKRGAQIKVLAGKHKNAYGKVSEI